MRQKQFVGMPLQQRRASLKRSATSVRLALSSKLSLVSLEAIFRFFCSGLCYVHGRGVAQDESKAVYWWQTAAAQGDAHAQLNLGLCQSPCDVMRSLMPLLIINFSDFRSLVHARPRCDQRLVAGVSVVCGISSARRSGVVCGCRYVFRRITKRATLIM